MRTAYLFYEAGQAVAAAHLGLKIRHISGNPAAVLSDIVIPKKMPKAPMIMWLTGMAAEKKGVGRSDPLRRTRNRLRVKSQLEAIAESLTGSRVKRLREARTMLNQAQDRANAICGDLYPAIEQVVELLSKHDTVSGDQVAAIVREVKDQRYEASQAASADGVATIVPTPPAKQSAARKRSASL
jgi:hypothetical protein